MSKIELSEEELRMDGAPSGDIFSVEVVSDEHLPALEDPDAFFDTIPPFHWKDAPWPDQFRFIEKIRCVLKHHLSDFKEDYIPKTISCLVDSLESLRSSTIKNALKASSSLILSIDLKQRDLNKIVHAICLKTSGCPKFIIEQAVETLQSSFHRSDPLKVILALLEATAHKNADVISYAHVMMRMQVERLDLSEETNLSQVFDPSFYGFTHSLCLGLNGKKVPGKEACRAALRYMHAELGTERFKKLVSQCGSLSPSQLKLVDKEVTSVKPSSKRIRSPVKEEDPGRKRLGSISDMGGKLSITDSLQEQENRECHSEEQKTSDLDEKTNDVLVKESEEEKLR